MLAMAMQNTKNPTEDHDCTLRERESEGTELFYSLLPLLLSQCRRRRRRRCRAMVCACVHFQTQTSVTLEHAPPVNIEINKFI